LEQSFFVYGMLVAIILIMGPSSTGCSRSDVDSTSSGVSSPRPTPVAQAPSTTAPSPATPFVRLIPLDQFGSAKSKWHKALTSIVVRDDVLVVTVKRDVSHDEAVAIEAAARDARDRLGLSIKRFQIQYSKNGYLLKYGSL
jgi:hypothetical protein